MCFINRPIPDVAAPTDTTVGRRAERSAALCRGCRYDPATDSYITDSIPLTLYYALVPACMRVVVSVKIRLLPTLRLTVRCTSSRTRTIHVVRNSY